MKFKNIYSVGLIALAGLTLVGCDDFLDENRYPQTSIVNNPEYWNNMNNCNLQVNRFYQYYYGYSTGTSTGSFYFSTLSDDQCGNSFKDWTFTNVPSSSTTFTSPYTVIRGCNIIIENMAGTSHNEKDKNNIIAQARLNRGWYYYQLVKKYGDVPLVDHVLDLDSPELYGPRTPRKTVMDFAYEDLKFASENITMQSGMQYFTKDLALAMLSEVCLFEGTFWKYCTLADNYYAPDAERSKLYLERCAAAAGQLIPKYPIGDDYRALYNSQWTAANGITGLSSNKEVIFATQYLVDVLMHATVAYTCSSTSISGISKDAFDAFYMKDGKPFAESTLAGKTDEGVAVTGDDLGYGDGKGLSIQNLLDQRDARLAQITDPYIYYKNMTWARAASMQMTSSSGYGVSKFDNVKMPVKNRNTTGQNYTCAPYFWGAVICLDYAEAKAELGTLTQDDIDKTLNKLYKRADIPAKTLADLNTMNASDNNMGVSSLIFEVRRCRRCELIMDKDYRYWDLVRWHKLDLLDNTQHPNILLGANVANAPVAPESKTGNYVNATFGKNRVFDNRQYQYPIPTDQITLNAALVQNANWTGTK